MDDKFFNGWFEELNNGLDKMSIEECSRLFSGCAERCTADALKYLYADLYEEWDMNHTDLEERIEHYKNLSYFSQNENNKFMIDRRKRDCFEDWLLGNGFSASSAVYNACYIPLLKIISIFNDFNKVLIKLATNSF